MKKLLLVLPLVALAASPSFAETIRLTCRTDLSETDPSVKEQYDVVVMIEGASAILNVDGKEYALEQQPEEENNGGTGFFRWDPWYNLQIDNEYISPGHKYALGIPTDEPFARYTSCEEIAE